MNCHSLFRYATLTLAGLVAAAAWATPITPAAKVADNVTAINTAIASAGSGGVVELGEGIFEINDTLQLTGGVTLQGQGWEKTIIRQTAWGKRCVLIDGGSTLTGVTLTGGQSFGNYETGSGAGAQVNDGTISWCCISNNWVASGNNSYGAGVLINKGKIGHSIIADNRGGNYSVGGGIGAYDTSGPIVIDTCLIYGNTAKDNAGGIGFNQYNADVTIRNCTITANTSESGCGGVRVNSTKFVVVNTIITGNTAGGVESNNALAPSSSSSNNLIDGDPKFVRAANFNFHLTPNSPVRGAGVTYENIGVDLDGAAFADPPSIGCYEYITSQSGVENPMFDPESTAFTTPIAVTLVCGTPDAAICYTTDGTDPTEASTPYDGPITVSATTTLKVRAFKSGWNPSEVVSETYTYEAPVPPTLGEVTVTPRSARAKFSVELATIGNDFATACDVYLSCGTDEDNLPEMTKVLSGVTDSFDYAIRELSELTTYYYTLAVSNNAATARGAVTSGSFTTLESGPITPEATAAETWQTIQDALDDAAAETPAGTVTLGEGLFEINAELTLAAGVTLEGQGWTNTIIKQTTQNRVATVKGGSSLVGVTVTGGYLGASWAEGAGVKVEDGTISWCRICDNKCPGNNAYGGGVKIENGMIDHSLIATNSAGGSTSGGGGIGCYNKSGTVVIDTCLICDNTVPNGSSKGGGIGFNGGNPDLTIRNTTIAGNSAGEAGGGLFVSSSRTKLINSIVAENMVGTEEGDISVTLAAGSTNNVVGGKLKFVDSANGDYHLQAGSPAAKAGGWYEDIAVDLDHVERKTENMSAGCYECTQIDPGLIILSPLDVTSTITSVTVSASIETLGEGTSATVTLSCGRSEDALTETATGVTTNFSLTVSGLTHATPYVFVLAVENNVGRTIEEYGDFLTQYDPEQMLRPSDDPAENVATLGVAFASAAQSQATVTLGEGVFLLNAPLDISGGITVVGQGWERTVLKQTVANSVATISGGASLVGVTVTGGRRNGNWNSGGGLILTDGTVSWCCISNNVVTGNNIYGAGVLIADKAQNCTIDHSIIAFNSLTGMSGVGAGIGGNNVSGNVTIDTCLIHGNDAPNSGNGGGKGAGIGFNGGNPNLTVCNTTIADNSAATTGGGVFLSGNRSVLVNNLVANNTVVSEEGEANVAGTMAEGSTGNFIGVDPLFKDPANGNYHLFSNSPAAKTGTWYEGISVDLDGKVHGSVVTPGCYEVGIGTIFLLK